MSRNAKIILIAVLAVVLAACLILAFVLPGKDAGNDKVSAGETNSATGESADTTETADTETGNKQDSDIIIDVDIPDTTKPSGSGNSGSGNSGSGNSGSSGSGSGDSDDQLSEDENAGGQTGTKVELEIDFDDLLGGDDKDEDKTEEPEEPVETTAPTNGGNGAAKVEDQDIVIEF